MYYVFICPKCNKAGGSILKNINNYKFECKFCGNIIKVREKKKGYWNVKRFELNNEKEIQAVVSSINQKIVKENYSIEFK